MGICVIGAGSWGTGVVALLGAAGAQRVQWWCRSSEQALAIHRDRRNPAHFPQYAVPDGVHATSDLSEALDGCATVYLVVPAAGVREVVTQHSGAWELWQDLNVAGGAGLQTREVGRSEDLPHSITPILVNCSKGLLVDPVARTDAWLAGALPRASLVHLSGPNLAAEIVAGQPAAAVAASADALAAQRVQAQLASAQFRVYTGDDVTGVEVAGFYKNIIAIAAGLADGLQLGANARAVLITRGLAEMARVVAHFGGDPATLHGLAGVGDLIVTCSSALSRNFQVGRRRAGGQTLAQIEAEMDETAEGVNTSRALWELISTEGAGPSARPGWAQGPTPSQDLELPIARAVTRVLHEGMEPREALAELMLRPMKAE